MKEGFDLDTFVKEDDDCSKGFKKKFGDRLTGIEKITIASLLDKKPESILYSYEIPRELLQIFDIDMLNAVIGWYQKWKLVTPPEMATTCMIGYLFSDEAPLVIIMINLYKYLRGLGYDPDIVEKGLRLPPQPMFGNKR